MQDEISEEILTRAIRFATRGYIIVEGIVTDVDNVQTNYTCGVTVGSGTDSVIYPAVNLRIVTNAQGSYLEIPNENSDCLLMFRDGSISRPQIIMIDSVKQFIFNGGQLGGLIDIAKAVTSWNNLENSINNLIAAIKSWEPVPNDGGAALKVALETWLTQNIPVTQRTNIEDTTILH